MAMVTPSKAMTCFIGSELLQSRTSTSEDTVRRARRDLTDAGWLRLFRKGTNVSGNQPAVYRPVFPR